MIGCCVIFCPITFTVNDFFYSKAENDIMDGSTEMLIVLVQVHATCG